MDKTNIGHSVAGGRSEGSILGPQCLTRCWTFPSSTGINHRLAISGIQVKNPLAPDPGQTRERF